MERGRVKDLGGAGYPGATVVNREPLIAYRDNYLSAAACREFIALGRESLQRATVSFDDGSGTVPGRSGSNTWLRYDRFAPARALGERLSEFVRIPLAHAEAIQLIHYGPEQRYGAHYDAYDLGTERGRRCCRRGGQRLVTCLVYLNDVSAGGRTRFPRLNLEIAPKTGRLVVFHNVAPGDFGRPHPHSLHGGEPVLAGEKWAMNIWFHEADRQTEFPFDAGP